jgi:hypothetical protein
MVNGKKFPYTASGMAAAKKAESESGAKGKAKEVAKKMAAKSMSKGAKNMNAYLAKLGPMTAAQRNREKEKATKKIQYGD